MAFVKNTAVNGFPFTLANTVTGDPITSGTVTGWYLIDGGAQTSLSGTATHEGNGQWSWSTIPAAAMNGTLIGLLFIHADGRASFTIRTTTSAAGDVTVGAATEVELCNLALLELGADLITSMEDDTDRARLCDHWYPQVRDECLAEIQPHVSIVKALLVAAATPTFGWDYAYTRPTDCLVPLGMDDEDAEWQVEGATIVCDYTPAYLMYVSKLTDVTKYPPHFTRALVAGLVYRLSYAVTKAASLKAESYRAYRQAVAEALALEGQEGGPIVLSVPTLTTNVRS